jgi:hypothetical protein
MPITSLPLILAGPILRRVESTSVSVWVALSESASVHLEIFQGRLADLSATTRFFTTSPVLAFGDAMTIKIGKNLHVSVVTAPIAIPLTPGSVYSYLLSIDGTNDLKTEGLLASNSDVHRPKIALGYATGFLPSFVLPSASVDDLLILHGSCRKPHGPGRDALAYADKLIEASLTTPLKRPQQLFLTGDQIYADDVADALLLRIGEVDSLLFGSTPEKLPVGNVPPEGAPIDATLTNFPAGRRQDLVTDWKDKDHNPIFSKAGFSSTDAASHLLSFREFCTMYLLAWSNELWPDSFPTDVPPPQQASAIESSLSLLDEKKKKKAAKRYKKDVKSLNEFQAALPKVRRVLANIPSYMIFDDHEITDDWYIMQSWRDKVLATTLGSAILRNGLAAYAVFQAWGNVPAYFTKPSIPSAAIPLGAKLLDTIVNYAANTEDVTNRRDLETSVGMAGTAPASDRVDWHYTVTGKCHHVIVLDTRTHRMFRSPDAPPALIDVTQIDTQIQPAAKPVDVTVLISAAPVLGIALMETLFQPLYAIWESRNDRFDKRSGRLGADCEAWSFDDNAYETLLKKLVPLLPHLVLLGGDVHYSFSSFLTYWKSATLRGRMVQLTSSALKNQSPLFFDRNVGSFLERVINSFAANAQSNILANRTTSLARIGWNTQPTITGGPLPYFYDRLTKVSPLLLPTLEDQATKLPMQGVFQWLAGLVISQPGDWSWRWHLGFDLRDDTDSAVEPRPNSVRPQPLTNEQSLNDFISKYEAALRRQGQQVINGVPRTAYWDTSIGRISFDRDGNGELAVRHGLLGLDGGNVIAPVAHTIPFDASAETEPTIP